MGQCIPVRHGSMMAHKCSPMDDHEALSARSIVSSKDCMMSFLLCRVMMHCTAHALFLSGPSCWRDAEQCD